MLLTRMLELLGRYLIVFIPLFAVLMIANKILKKRNVECFVTKMSFAKKTAALMFVPFGFFVCLFSKRPFVSLFASFLTSVAIEVIQIFIGRTCDIDDVICNTLGGLVGICLSIVLMKIIKLINQRITR